MADQFFARLEAAVVPPEETPEVEADSAEGEALKKGWFRRMMG